MRWLWGCSFCYIGRVSSSVLIQASFLSQASIHGDPIFNKSFALSRFFSSFMLVPAVHLLIKISRFQSHFSFSALQRDGEHYSVQKTAFKKKKRKKSLYTMQFRCIQKTVYSGHQKIKYYKVSPSGNLVSDEMRESTFLWRNVVDSPKDS